MVDSGEMNGRSKELLDVLTAFLKTGKVQLLDEEGLDEELMPYVKTLNKFFADYKELQQFLGNLSSGKLMIEPPSRRNLIANPLKNLHAQLLHITWQAQQVANGDYQQSVDFMGEFAEAFNKMTGQLMERERRMNQNFDMLIQVLENTPDIVIVVDAKGAVLFRNRAADVFMKELEGHDCPHGACIVLRRMFEVTREDNDTVRELFCTNHGHYLNMNVSLFEWADSGDAFLLVVQDVTSSRRIENELRSAAYVDATTGVGNRNGATEYLSRLRAEDAAFALVFADMDKLKVINDVHGHSEGDNALRAMAEYLRVSLREKDSVFRIGGDEFIVVMRDCSACTANKVMRRIRERLSEINEGKPYELSFSFGVYEHKADSGLSVEETLAVADTLMYEDKRKRRAERVD